ncbi:TrkH family potassium uptake protein [Sporosarcina pasteurii]|uniref:Ktr system potassium uptake protein B n=1 Tax=Sporosarcina pasteurii TaxID=1474 RepID=A0A380BFR3_SPOPA|nr:potassium transporter TrkG [Sporosarcina pasteurii]MDS9470413.1 potassium transporter TrkG [Sporosarcina pasteurii]QBQ05888.1 TrkH family potassium uptake protein [Sporosarcina pasteurii]SUJ00208.1 Ktr system potassium uptake protein B [Sporosarcina pasteurii]
MKYPREAIKRFTAVQILVFYYFLAIAFSFFLLNLPGVYKPGIEVKFIDSVFTAVSAVSVTGLTPISIGDTYTSFGIAMLMVVLQLGGIGVMSLGTFFWLMIKKRIGLRERQLMMADHNQYELAGIVQLIRQIVQLIFTIELVGGLIFTVYILNDFETFGEAFLNGLFMAVSATTNAGFSLDNASLQPYFNDYFIQICTMILIVLGAIGFPVLAEVRYYFSRNKRKNFRFSLFTKITTVTFGFLLVFGAVMIFILESMNSFKGMAWHEKVFTALFHSVSSRSAGLTTFDVTQFSNATDILISSLMFIGASPSSVGGGIRTTTLAIAVLFLISFARGQEVIHVFHRQIKIVDVFRSYAVILLAGLMVLIAVVVLLVTEPTLPAHALLFEITSAFGTCGMSLGITSELSITGKIIIMVLMFIGRVGLISFLFTLGGRTQKPHYHYPKERVIIG